MNYKFPKHTSLSDIYKIKLLETSRGIIAAYGSAFVCNALTYSFKDMMKDISIDTDELILAYTDVKSYIEKQLTGFETLEGWAKYRGLEIEDYREYRIKWLDHIIKHFKTDMDLD